MQIYKLNDLLTISIMYYHNQSINAYFQCSCVEDDYLVNIFLT